MRFALGIEYQGSAYRGFQRQPGQPTVQAQLERCLGMICDHHVEVVCAGRTDAGVSATGQVIHFDTPRQRQAHNLLRGGNAFLPSDIAITWARSVADDFHARFSALARRYRYLIYVSQARAAILAAGLLVCPGQLNVEAMHACAQLLLGEHDFSAFCAADEQSPSHWRCVQQVQVSCRGSYVVVDITANAFLNHMVRNIVGSLLLVGRGKRDQAWFAEVLRAGERSRAGPAAPPGGLYLVNVIYPAVFSLPQRLFLGPLWLP